MAGVTKFSNKRRRPRPALVVLLVLLHIAALYGLAKAFAPDFTGNVESQVVRAITVTITTPEEDMPEPEPEPDAGAAGEQGRKATPKAQAAPEVPIPRDTPMPKVASTGAAVTSGARDTGEGTGAASGGEGTGSGRGGSGQGGGIATKPVHISGGINAARDYPVPPGGRQTRFGTRVVVKVTVGTNGRASNCSIFRQSPDPEADRITCQLVVERLRFEPAKDDAGNPVPAPFYWQQKWSQAGG